MWRPVHDARRIGVVGNGLPLWHGAQVAVDATIASPIARDRTLQPRADVVPGTVLRNAAANRKRRQKYQELGRSHHSSCSLSKWPGAGVRKPHAASRSLPPHVCVSAYGECGTCTPSRCAIAPGSNSRAASSLWRRNACWPRRSSRTPVGKRGRLRGACRRLELRVSSRLVRTVPLHRDLGTRLE